MEDCKKCERLLISIFSLLNMRIAEMDVAAKKNKGATGPSGMDSDCWKRILCSKSFARSHLIKCHTQPVMLLQECVEECVRSM